MKKFDKNDIVSDIMEPISRDAFEKVQDERLRQLKKWGIQRHSFSVWGNILSEENGEVSKAILENNVEELKDELIQTATVALNVYDILMQQEVLNEDKT